MKRNVQSLSICVPGKQCINRCKFCVSCMHTDIYKNQMDENLPFYDLYFEDYVKRLIFAKENDANIMMITGDIEPLQNRSFLQTLSLINKYVLPHSGCSAFNWIEIQTSAVGFDQSYARFLRNTVGVSVFSFSLSSFDNRKNAEIVNMPKNKRVNIKKVCSMAKEYDFTLRLSLNMSKEMLKNLIEVTYGRLTVISYSKNNKCKCGNFKIISSNLLQQEYTKSCGYLDKEKHIPNPNRTTHLHRYKGNLSIDRIDSNENYEPSNCNLATAKEQRYNQTRCKKEGVPN